MNTNKELSSRRFHLIDEKLGKLGESANQAVELYELRNSLKERALQYAREEQRNLNTKLEIKNATVSRTVATIDATGENILLCCKEAEQHDFSPEFDSDTVLKEIRKKRSDAQRITVELSRQLAIEPEEPGSGKYNEKKLKNGLIEVQDEIARLQNEEAENMVLETELCSTYDTKTAEIEERKKRLEAQLASKEAEETALKEETENLNQLEKEVQTYNYEFSEKVKTFSSRRELLRNEIADIEKIVEEFDDNLTGGNLDNLQKMLDEETLIELQESFCDVLDQEKDVETQTELAELDADIREIEENLRKVAESVEQQRKQLVVFEEEASQFTSQMEKIEEEVIKISVEIASKENIIELNEKKKKERKALEKLKQAQKDEQFKMKRANISSEKRKSMEVPSFSKKSPKNMGGLMKKNSTLELDDASDLSMVSMDSIDMETSGDHFFSSANASLNDENEQLDKSSFFEPSNNIEKRNENVFSKTISSSLDSLTRSSVSKSAQVTSDDNMDDSLVAGDNFNEEDMEDWS